MRFLRRLLVLAALMGLAPAALAHLMPAQKGTVNVQGGSAFVVISIPVSALVRVDASGDGRLSADELDAQRAAIESQVAWGVRLFAGGEQGALEFVQVDGALDEDEQAQPWHRNRATAVPVSLAGAAGRGAAVFAPRRHLDRRSLDAGQRRRGRVANGNPRCLELCRGGRLGLDGAAQALPA